MILLIHQNVNGVLQERSQGRTVLEINVVV